jgi:hypothetical protein
MGIQEINASLAFGVVASEGVNVTNGKSIFESRDNSPLS